MLGTVFINYVLAFALSFLVSGNNLLIVEKAFREMRGLGGVCQLRYS